MNKLELINLSKNITISFMREKFTVNETGKHKLIYIPVKFNYPNTPLLKVYSIYACGLEINQVNFFYDVDSQILTIQNYKPKYSDEQIVVEYYFIFQNL